VFVQGDIIGAFVEAYTRTADAAARLVMTTTLCREDGEVVFSSTEVPDRGHRGQVSEEPRRYVVYVPLRSASPGEYVLRVEAHVDATETGACTVRRALPVKVAAASAALAIGDSLIGPSAWSLGNKGRKGVV
jgi:hypothetical protein